MTTKDHTTNLENKTILKRIMDEAWNKHNLSVFDEFVSPDLVYYTGSKVFQGLNEFKILAYGFSEAFHETKITIGVPFAERDRVAIRSIFEGIHKGRLGDLPPTGKKVKVSILTLARFIDGKMIECWEEFDNLDMMQQLGMELMPKEAVHWEVLACKYLSLIPQKIVIDFYNCIPNITI